MLVKNIEEYSNINKAVWVEIKENNKDREENNGESEKRREKQK